MRRYRWNALSRRRKVKARSLVFDLFGDYLRYRGGETRLRVLVELASAFDVPAATVRVAVARLRTEGWLLSRRDSRETIYALTDASWKVLDDGRERIFRRAVEPWDGQWHMVIYSVPESERRVREQLRNSLAWAGFGQLSPATWLSPHNRGKQIKDAFRDKPSVRLDLFQTRSAGAAKDREIASRCWDLEGLNNAYRELVMSYNLRLPSYRAGRVQGADALVERMRLVHDYRLFPFRDPDLPVELLTHDWSGDLAHNLFLEAHGLLREPAEAYVDRVIDSLSPPGRR